MGDRQLAPRLRRLATTIVLGHEAPVASGLRVRLLGLALLDREQAGAGLLIPHCASVHTFGMRFPLDLFFLDGRGAPLAIHRNVPPRRLISARGAVGVLEIPASRPHSAGESVQRGGEFGGLKT